MARVSRKEVNQTITTNAPSEKYKVGIYVRLSLEGKEKANTLENQKALITTYLESKSDVEIVQTYSDHGFTGTNFNRPAFLQMIEDVKAKKINCIAVKDLSRFGRNYIEVGNYLENIFPFLGVRFIAITDGFDTLTAERNTDGYIIPLKNLVNHLYSKDISKKVGTALRNKQKNGEFLGAWAAYGYLKDPNHKTKIIVDEEVAHNVVKIFELAIEGYSYRKIVTYLNENNIIPPSKYRFEKGLVKHEKFSKYQWAATTIKSILENPVYIGSTRCGMEYVSIHDNIPRTQMPKNEWIITENTHTPLISKDVFGKVSEMIKERATKARVIHDKNSHIKSSESVLNGLIYCAECGAILTRKRYFNKSKKKNNELYYIYVCFSKAKSASYCTFKTIREDVLIKAVLSAINKHIDCLLNVEKIITNLQTTTEFKGKMVSYSTKIKKLDKQISQNLIYRKSLFASYVAKEITEKDYVSLSKTYEDEHKELEYKLNELTMLLSETDVLKSKKELFSRLRKLKNLETLDRETALALIDKIIVSENKNITISLKYNDDFLKLRRWYNDEK